jgi:dGTPase
LVEAVCLAHDLGHPPFGHAGEKALNVLMARFGGFEGNAQTLRLLTETMWPNTRDGGRQGMAPTRGLLDGVLKYKRTTDGSESDSKFIYVEQIEIVDFVHGLSGTVPSKLKSLECQIMDWADEIAYSVGDVIDGFNARFITIDRLKRWNNKDRDEALVKKLIDAFENTGSDSRFAAKTIGECIEACSLTSASSGDWTPKSDRYRYHLYIDPPMKRTVKCLKAISLDMVFRSPAVEQLEYKAKRILNDLFNTLGEVYMPAPPFKRHLLSTEVEKILTKACCENARARILCDQISGMSDEYAVRMHRRLHEPEFGSIADIVE